MQRSRAVFVTGVIYALIGLVLAAGGMWLAALGGSIFYIILGAGILLTAALGWTRRPREMLGRFALGLCRLLGGRFLAGLLARDRHQHLLLAAGNLARLLGRL
jgi:quinoprotein glucose dehydrogenase